MPGERLSMRKIRELLRLRWEHHLPQRRISQSLGLSQGSVSGLTQPGSPRWPDLAAARDAGRRTARGTAVSADAGRTI
jgi:hypothetical protein